MIQFFKTKKKEKNKIFFKSSVGNIEIFFIDNIFKIPNNIEIKIEKKQIFFNSLSEKLSLSFTDDILFFSKNRKLILIINLHDIQRKKKSILNLYNKLIKTKIKGILQGFKLNLILKGIGFKSFIENKNLILKLGYSHNIVIPIPANIKIVNQSNNLIFSSIDHIHLSQFVHFIKNFKKPEPYKGKGLLLKNEIILRKEGKKSKK